MDSMVNENGVSFKTIEKEIYRLICEVGRELTKEILERYDESLHETRNKAELRDKGCRRSTIKTVYRDKFMPAAVAHVAVVDKSKTNKLKIIDQNSSTKATLTFKVGDEIDYRFIGCTEWGKAKGKDAYWDSYNDDIFLCAQATAGKFVAMKPGGKTKVALAVYCDGKIVGYDEIKVELTK